MKTITLAICILASVAASANWPTFHGDNQRSGRSSVAGPINPTIRWAIDLKGPIITSPIVGPDGTIYTGSVWDESLLPKAFINAINPDGTFKWRFETEFIDDQSVGSPAVGPEGNIYVGTATGTFYAIGPNGQELWRYTALDRINTHPLVKSDGTVYMKMDGMLFAFSPTGAQLWQFPLNSNTPSSPALAADGTIYAQGAAFYAINPSGTLKWTANIGDSWITPAVAPNGQIIRPTWFGTNAINPADGTVAWSRSDGSDSYTSPAIDASGNIFIVDDYRLRKLTPTGGTVWSTLFEYSGALEHSHSAPIIDPNGRVYFGLGTWKRAALAAAKGLVIYDGASGTKLVNFLLPEPPSTSMPAMASDGTLYMGCLDGKLYAFGDPWEPVMPSSYTVMTGSETSYNLAALLASDDVKVTVQSNSTLGFVSLIEVHGVSPIETPSRVRFILESSTNMVGRRRMVQLYNYTNTTWETLSTTSIPLVDGTVLVNVTSNASRFVKPGTKDVRARIACDFPTASRDLPRMFEYIDQAIWEIQ